MATVTSSQRRSLVGLPFNKQLWAGRVLSAVPIALLTLSGVIKLMHEPEFVGKWTGGLGWSESSLTSIALLELLCVALYVVPQTAVLGSVLLTGYLGGAIASHVRIGDPFVIPLVLGVLVWGGIYLRDERLRALLPRRSAPVTQ